MGNQAKKDTPKTALEKLKEEYKKANHKQKIIINNCLLPELKNNANFEQRILQENKTIDGMLRKIEEWVRKSKNDAPSHDAIFSLAIHYYQEDNPEYVEELLQEEDPPFGDIQKEFNTPIIKYITGTVIKETIKEVIKTVEAKSTKDNIKKSKTKRNVSNKVKKVVENNLKDINQLSIFDLNED